MPWSKRDIISEAFAELGKGSYSFDVQPEEYQMALRRLDTMMATWGGAANIRIGYAGGEGFGDLGVDATIPDWAVSAMYLNLAISLAPAYGKTVSPDTKTNAKLALQGVMNNVTELAPRYLGGYAGAGYGRSMALPSATALLETGAGGVLDIET